MGSRGPVGRKNLPIALRLVENEDDGNKRIPSAAEMVSPTAPERPESLPSDLQPLWILTVGELDKSGLLARVDGMALELALLHYRAATDAARELDAEGPTVAGAMGGVVKNPASQVFKENTAAFVELSKQLGLTFAARARIVVPEVQGDALDAGSPFGAASGG